MAGTGSIGVSGFQTDQVVDPSDLQLGRVLDGYDTLVMGDVIRQGIEEGSLAAACTAADENVVFCSNQKLQFICDFLSN